MEIWKNIIGYKPIYQVSNYGRVKSISRTTNCNKGKSVRKERILRFTKTAKGYINVYLYGLDGKKRTVLLHRLVANMFLKNEKGLNEVDHIDGNKENNKVDNLRFVTRKENCNNIHTLEKFKKRRGEKSARSKKVLCYTREGSLVGSFVNITEAAAKTGTCRHSISSVCKGKYKSANNLIFKYYAE